MYYMAPDVLLGEYDMHVDIWALGVILFMLLSGSPPFNGATKEDVYEAIVAGSLCFEASSWDCISPSCCVLITRLLAPIPSHRPSTVDVLGDKWLSQSS